MFLTCLRSLVKKFYSLCGAQCWATIPLNAWLELNAICGLCLLNSLRLGDAYKRQRTESSFVQGMACTKPVPELSLTHLSIWPLGTNFSEVSVKIQNIYFKKMIWKCRLEMSDILFKPRCVKTGILLNCGLFLSANKLCPVVYIINPLSTHYGLNEMPNICSRHFHVHFLDNKRVHFDRNVVEVYS